MQQTMASFLRACRAVDSFAALEKSFKFGGIGTIFVFNVKFQRVFEVIFFIRKFAFYQYFVLSSSYAVSEKVDSFICPCSSIFCATRTDKNGRFIFVYCYFSPVSVQF